MFGRVDSIHMVGIGGIGMSGIAHILHNIGFAIAGSDIARSEITQMLEQSGIRVHIVHSKENLKEADVVVISSAIKPDNGKPTETVVQLPTGRFSELTVVNGE